MRFETREVRIGEDVGPVDWTHPTAADKPQIWRDAEKNPIAYRLNNGGWKSRAIYKICMYDGWPYWKPTPAILHESPLGGGEWSHFNSYGIHDSSIVPAQGIEARQGGDANAAPSRSDESPVGASRCAQGGAA